MAFELPTDLINQVQIAARNAAGLNTYNPDDPSLPPLPSFGASIFGLDPSAPDHLRCKNCKGKLLRGVDSVICIYCGKQQINNDLPPHPISFTQTFGYQWLLHSLDLDQSETVGPSTKESESNRGHSTPHQETSLHHLLDLQITWPDELEMPDTSVPHKTSEQSSSSFNVRGADLDNVFSGSKRGLDSDAFAQPITEKQLDSVESKGSISGFGSVQENLTFMSDVDSADSVVKSFKDNQGDSFSGWAADFQSANKEESSNSYDSVVASNIDLSSHIDSVFGAGKDENCENIGDELQPAQSVSDDWMQDDLWKNVDSKVSQQAVQCSSTSEATNGISPDNYNNTASSGVDWFENNQRQKDITSEPSNKIIDTPDDSFDEWNDFASSSNDVNPSGDEPSKKNIDKPDGSFDYWNDFASISNAVNPSGGEPSKKIIDKPDDSFDDWNIYESSNNVVNLSGGEPGNDDVVKLSGDEPSNKIIDRPDDSSDGWNDFAGSSSDVNLSGIEPSSKIIDKPDNTSDDWNDFASTSNYVDLSGNAWKDNNHQKAVSNEQTSEINLFSSTGNIQDNEFSSVIQPKKNSGLPGGYDSDAMTNNTLEEVYASERNNNEQSHVKESPEETVGPSNEVSELNKGQIIPNQEASLYHLSDLKITWPNELEMPDTSVPHKTPEQSSNSFNLSGADLDNIFSGSNKNVDSGASAQIITEKQLDNVESKVSISGFGSVQENLTIFLDDRSADSAVKSFEDSQRESLSEWPEDFQSASKDESSNSYDPFVASSIDLSSHIDSVFGARKVENRGKLEDDLQQPSQSVSHDWMQGDPWKNVDFKVSQKVVHFGSTAEATDGISPKTFENPASEGVDWFEDNLWQKNITSEPSNKIIDQHYDSSDDWTDFASSNAIFVTGGKPSDKIIGKPEDSFDDWNGFASSSNMVNLSGNEPSSKNIDKPDDSFDDWNDFASSSNAVKLSGDEPSNKIIDNHNDSSDDWNDFATSSNAVNISGDEPSNKVIDKPDDSDDWNDFASSSNAVNFCGDQPSNKIIGKPDYSFDYWNDFASSSNAVKLSGDERSNKIIDKHNGSSDDWNDFATSSNAVNISGDIPSNKVLDKPDDSDDWNDFASSSNAINLSGDQPSNKVIGKPDDSFKDWNVFASSSNAVNLSGDEPSGNIIDKPDDTFDDWNDFASSSIAVNLSGDEPSSKIIDKPDDSFAGWNDFASSSNDVNIPGNELSTKIIEKPDDPFDDPLDNWNDFASTISGFTGIDHSGNA